MENDQRDEWDDEASPSPGKNPRNNPKRRLAALPQPEPVPGAAVRALADRWRAGPSTWGSIAAAELEAALRADGLASVELPTREALADALNDAFFEPGPGPQDWGIVADKAIELLARRPATDDRASVSVPQGDDLPAPERERWRVTLATARSERDQLRAELEKARSEHQATAAEFRAYIEKSDAELEMCKRISEARIDQLAVLSERHEKTRAELEACKVDYYRVHNAGAENRTALRLLREQHEALRAAAQSAADAARRITPMGISAELGALAALLKPAPAEAEPKRDVRTVASSPNGNAVYFDADPEPIQHPPPESARVEHERLGRDTPRLAPIWAEVDALRETLRTFLHDWAQGSFNKARAAEVLEALDARKGA